MEELDELEKRWAGGVHLRSLRANLCLDEDGLKLGVTRLVAKGDAGLELQGNEARVFALLSLAHGRPVGARILNAVRRASKHVAAGDDALAAMHIALAGLPRLSNPVDDARRIFIADGLIERGVSPRDLFAALDFDSASLDELQKFNPDEPRVPAGSGRPSGEWTSEIEEAESAGEDTLEATGRMVASSARTAAIIGALEIAGEVAAIVAPPIVFLGTLLIPTPAGGRRVTGEVAGHPDLYYSWNSDETELRIRQRSDNRVILSATLRPDGTLVQGPQRIGRRRGNKVVIYPFSLPTERSESEMRDDDRRMCPKESPDKAGRQEDKGGKGDRDFEDRVKLFVNPDAPTPRGFGYAFIDPTTGREVIFDDCQKKTGFLFDAKSTKYAKMLTDRHGRFRKGVVDKLFDQADRQILASEKRHIYWVFAEKQAARIVDKLFHHTGADSKYQQITVFWLDWRRD